MDLWHAKPELGIEIPAIVVVPGQPVNGVQLARGQRHHLGETGIGIAHLVDQAFRRHDELI